MEVDDYDLSSTTQASSDPTSAANPVYQYSPILNLASLLGSATAGEYSQLQGYKSVSIGKLKVHCTMLAHATPAAAWYRDHIRMVWALMIAPSEDAQGTPQDDLDEINPFLSSVVPIATEALKNPWDEGMDTGHARYLWLRRHTFWVGTADRTGMFNRPATIELNFKLRRGYRLRETSTLYAAVWWYADFDSPTANDVHLREHMHVGVPRRFNH